ncbi:hypothetical protein AB4Z09_27605 [Rhodococcus sp. TAF43]|uniref:hypothetical protein n=1 Tax=unclassified Rhodococcus (in: high G+C Gram-positive bacteria) TaxID=192944 RepID=UPI0015818F63|nr:hypothetical protein [Rhodococcus sp. W8901]QKT11579.1 hypothetical protein HUN07_13275 [Rhodococcus sp. W8901]
MALPTLSGRRTGVVLAMACAAIVLGSSPAGAEPASPSIPRGGLAAVNDVLVPQDPGFWNPEVRGTRVLTPIRPGETVYCVSGYETPPGCATLDKHWSSPQRDLVFVDVPMIGRSPVRVWMDILPRLNEGSLGQLLQRFFAR